MALSTVAVNKTAPMITIIGSPGTGKTTLAATFPKAIFIQAEKATTIFESFDADVMPMVYPVLPRSNYKATPKRSTKATLLAQLRELATEEHDRKTVIIDSVTTLHTRFEHELCEMYNVDNVADAAGGFQKGYLVVAEMHNEIMNACNVLRNKGMTIIFLAHTGIQRIKDSPELDEHCVYTMDMHKLSIPTYINQVDMVVYLAKDSFVSGKETNRKGQVTKYGKLIQTGGRKLITSSDGKIGYVAAKTRYPMDVELPLALGENPLLELIPFFNVTPSTTNVTPSTTNEKTNLTKESK